MKENENEKEENPVRAGDYLKTVEYDSMDADDVVRVIQEALNHNEFNSEQKLFVLGYILNKNKEEYIMTLKKRLNNQKVKMRSQRSKFRKEQEALATPKPPVKKFIYRKKV